MYSIYLSSSILSEDMALRRRSSSAAAPNPGDPGIRSFRKDELAVRSRPPFQARAAVPDPAPSRAGGRDDAAGDVRGRSGGAEPGGHRRRRRCAGRDGPSPALSAAAADARAARPG